MLVSSSEISKIDISVRNCAALKKTVDSGNLASGRKDRKSSPQ